MTATINVLVPVAVDSSVLVSSTATESYADYAAGTTYAKGTRCVSPVTRRIYESLQGGNVGRDPALAANLSGDAPWWLDYGPANRWAMFDTDVSTATVAASPFTVVLKPGIIKDFYLRMDADQLDIVIRSSPGGEIIRERHIVLEDSQPDDYEEYLFGAFRPRLDHVEQDLEPYHAMEITLTLTKATGPISCTVMDVGDLVDLGQTLSGAKVTPKTFSYIEQDKFGGAKIKRRGAANDLAISGILDRRDSGAVHRTLLGVLDTACLVIASAHADYSPLRCYGLVSGGIEYPNIPDKCMLNINVQGLIKWQ